MTSQRPRGPLPVQSGDALLRGGEVAALLGISPKTVVRWGDGGRLTVVRTPGRHRRYLAGEVYAMRDERGRGDGDLGAVA